MIGGAEALMILALIGIPILLIIFIFRLGKRSGEKSNIEKTSKKEDIKE